MSQFIEMFDHTEKTKPLSDFIEVSFPGEWGQEDKDGNGVKVIRTTNFTNTGKLNLDDVVTRDIDPIKVEKKRLKKGDIILERSGGTNENPVGRVVYFNENGQYLFNNFTQLLRCKEGVNSLFIFYSLYNYYQMNKNAIRSMGNKTTGIQNLKMDQYWQIPIADVSSEQQERFVSIYHQADKSEFDVIKSQFIEMIGSRDWPQMKLKDIVHEDCPISYGIVQPGDDLEDGVPIVRPIDMNETHLIDKNTLKHTSKEISDSYSRTILRGDEILVCVRGTTGLIALADGLKGCNVTRGITPLYFKPQFSRDYLFRAFLGQQVQDYIQDNTIGSTLKGINMSKLRELPICMPPEVVQEQFVTIAQQADKSESGCEYRMVS